MRKTNTLAVAAVATGLLVSPAVAGIGLDNEYQGNAKGDVDSFVGFDTRKGKVSNFTTFLTYRCESGSGGQATVTGDGKLKIKKGEFEGTLKGAPNPTRGEFGTAKLMITGKLPSKEKAKGTVKGIIEIPGGDMCTTGKLDWKAEKPQMTR